MAEAKVVVTRAAADDIRSPLLASFRFEGESPDGGALEPIDRAFGGAIARILERGDFGGRKDETVVLYRPADAGPERLLLVGLGKRSEFTLQALRRATGNAVRQAERLRVRELALHLEGIGDVASPQDLAGAAVEAAVMAIWDWRDLRTVTPDAPKVDVASIELIAGDDAKAVAYGAGVRIGEAYGRAANFARDLAIRPGNIATPTFLAEAARGLADRFGMKLTVLDRAAMHEQGLKALLAVAQGSQEEPRFIVLEHRRGGDRPVLALVGKGVTFDSGGISIKPAASMEDMKFDMSGAAGVLGAMQGIAELEVPANVVAVIPSTENLPSGTAVKPGDVIGSLLGKTIEVVNTDAEGRLILADALAYATRFEPAAMVNAATLTGAVGIALGYHAIGLMGNDESVIEEIRAAGERTGERCWQLPLWDDYRPQIDSPVADMKNTGGRPAGTITAAMFLKEFVGDTPWAHLDIAATAYRDEAAPWLRKGPTGVPARLLIEWVRARAGA